ncbi:NAD(P)-binding protein [Hypoxylon rubiginosum]|uniref:NAD(P)-binding protein n=1 Tax=Hypoxylon rubiginosum TaxID=110542 RepID=A0ACB9YVG3_9PEZI|nr:NAD(P)-binding protein [Hypoxylon rubiginosum]
MAHTIVLISGANRGLGKGLLARFLARPNHIVIAANRNPEHPTSKALATLPKGRESRLVVVKIDATIESEASEGVEQLKAQGIERLDVVVSNAGVSYAWPRVSELTTVDLMGHITPDLLGVIWLYQATFPLLKKSTNPKWITMGSVAGKLEEQPDVANTAYAIPKAAVHWVTKRINQEEDWLTAIVLHPGWVLTDMGIAASKGTGISLENFNTSLDDSCDGMVHLIDVATKESQGGKFFSWEGEQESW